MRRCFRLSHCGWLPISLFVISQAIICSTKAELPAKLILSGQDSRPPFEYFKDGKPAGIQVDIVKAVFSELGIPIKIHLTPPKRILIQLAQGKTHGVIAWAKQLDSAYQGQIVSTNVSQYGLIMSYYALKSSNIQNFKHDDIGKYAVGVLGLNIGNKKWRGFMEPNYKTYRDYETLLKTLFRKQIDIIRIEGSVVDYLSQEMGENETFVNISPLFVLETYFAFSTIVLKEDAALLGDKADKAVSKLIENGTIRKILQKHSKLEHFKLNNNGTLSNVKE